MNKLEVKFFDEYKFVDNICRDMFQSNQGVTEYIKQMEVMDAEGSRIVVNWREKYKKLKHLRWLRNKIAHESGAPDLTENDLIELQNFHNQLLKQVDPLAELWKKRRVYKRNVVKQEYYNPESDDSAISVFILICIVIIVIGLFWIFASFMGVL
ncbi:hypothetical protein SAMN02910453_0464 [Lachnospiraceae bacterium A10]|nr:hypothetical protein SAMN02910453_0464 [Lachnospiraceae bacterium A10]